MNTIGSRLLREIGPMLLCATAVSATACVPSASVGIGSYDARPIDPAGKVMTTGETVTTPDGIGINAGEVPAFASPYLGAVLLTLSNDTPEFIQIDSVSLTFGADLDKHVSIPAGEDLLGWGQAMAPRVDYWIGPSRRVVAYEPAADILNDIQRFQQTRLAAGDARASSLAFPSEHLLAGPFSIPPKLYTRKWLLIKSDSNIGSCLERMVVTLQAANRPPDRLLVQFRDKSLSQSLWQRAECRVAQSPWGV